MPSPLQLLGYFTIGAAGGLIVAAVGFCVFMCSGGAQARDEAML